MAEAKKQDSAKEQDNKSDELPDEAKTAAMRRREEKEQRIAGEMKLWEKQHKEQEKG
jgi:hypothetical protein